MAVKSKGRVTAAGLAKAREKVRDPSPKWEGCESWDSNKFMSHFRDAMFYYRSEHNGRDLKPQVIKWMTSNDYSKADIDSFKKSKDWRSNLTMGSIAACLNRGMTPQRDDFNNGRDSRDWLREQISEVLVSGKNDIEDVVEEKAAVPVVTIQERLRETACKMTEELEDAIDSFMTDPDAFDPKAFKVLNLLKGKEVKAAHARMIKGFYERNLEELLEAQAGKDDQLKEAYSHLSKAQMKKIISFYQEIESACNMLMEEAKVTRKPRAKKAVSKDKVVSKMKYLKTHEPLKLVSVNPADIIGAQELWVYNTKSRKIGKYVAAEFSELGVKGTSITGFNEMKSVQKTLRKPEEQLKEFKSAGKVALRKFLDDIKAVDIKLNGRINEETVLLKVL